jgi:putative chitinase
MLNEKILFAELKKAPFGKALTQSQVDGIKRLLRICDEENVTDLRHRANILAQVFHETGRRMQPVRETFATSDAGAIAALDRAYAAKKLRVSKPYWRDGFFGRGEIQLTHRANYQEVGDHIGVDLVSNPSRALVPDISSKIAVVGMRDGLFTGKRLATYFNATTDNAVAARRIVNGTDHDEMIAGYHRAFLSALKKASSLIMPVLGSDGSDIADELMDDATDHAVPLTKTVLMGLQSQLRDKGYFEVGIPDGKFGPKTQAALTAFQAVEHLPSTRVFDAETIARLETAGPRPVDEERANRTMNDLRKGGAKVVTETDKVKGASVITIVTSAVAVATDGVTQFFGTAWSSLETFRDAFASIPMWVWGVGALCIAVFMWRRANSAQLWRLDDERTGRHNGIPVPPAEPTDKPHERQQEAA